MTAPFHQTHNRTAYRQAQYHAYEQACETSSQPAFHLAFPRLAAQQGHHPARWTRDCLWSLDRNLLAGKMAAPDVSQEDFESYTAQFAVRLSGFVEQRERSVAEFCKDYAFEVPEAGSSGMVLHARRKAACTACVYLLASLLNHSCSVHPAVQKFWASWCGQQLGPNCVFRIGPQGLTRWAQPRHITVHSSRCISEGEELRIDYRKCHMRFRCQCALCRSNVIYFLVRMFEIVWVCVDGVLGSVRHMMGY